MKIRSFEAEQAQARKTTIFSEVSMTAQLVALSEAKHCRMVHSFGAHSPSRVVADRLCLLGSVNSRLGLHRL